MKLTSKFGANCGSEVLSQWTLVGSPACWRGGAYERCVISTTTKITLDNNKWRPRTHTYLWALGSDMNSLVEVKSGSRPALGRIAQIVAVGPSCVYSRWVTEVWYRCLIDTVKEKRRGWKYEKVTTYKWITLRDRKGVKRDKDITCLGTMSTGSNFSVPSCPSFSQQIHHITHWHRHRPEKSSCWLIDKDQQGRQKGQKNIYTRECYAYMWKVL